MAWYDSAGPAGAGFMKANQLFSEMNSREFENALRQAQAQQLMQNMSMAPQEFGLKRQMAQQDFGLRQQDADMRKRQLEQEMMRYQEKMGLDRQQFGLEERYKNFLMNPQPKPLSPKDILLMQKTQAEIDKMTRDRDLPQQKAMLDFMKFVYENDPEQRRKMAEAGQLPVRPGTVPYGEQERILEEFSPMFGVQPYGGSSWFKPWTWPSFTGKPKFTIEEAEKVLRGVQKMQAPSPNLGQFLSMFGGK